MAGADDSSLECGARYTACMAARAKMLVLLLACCCLPAYSHALNRIESVTESGAASWQRTYTYEQCGTASQFSQQRLRERSVTGREL